MYPDTQYSRVVKSLRRRKEALKSQAGSGSISRELYIRDLTEALRAIEHLESILSEVSRHNDMDY